MAKINPQWTVLFESLKEPARLLLLAVVAWILTVVVPQIDEDWVPAITIILRFVDKYLYEFGKETDNDNIKLGLTRF